jgi:hypothetical protein
MTARRIAAPLALLALPLVGCGGDDDAGSADADATPAADEGGDDAGATTDTGDAADAADAADGDAASGDDAGGDDAGPGSEFDFGTGVARVTVGDNSYEFDLTSGFTVCRDVFGGLQVDGNAESGEASIDMWIPPLDWETYADGRYDPPAVTVEDDTINAKWVADAKRIEILPDFPPEAKVDSFDQDGTAAQGSATFVNEYAMFQGPVEPVQGTFEVSCEG